MNDNQESSKQTINLFKDMERDTIVSSIDPENIMYQQTKKTDEHKIFFTDKLGEELKVSAPEDK